MPRTSITMPSATRASPKLRGAAAFLMISRSRSFSNTCAMVKPKPISEREVRITDISVRSALIRVRWNDMPVRRDESSVCASSLRSGFTASSLEPGRSIRCAPGDPVARHALEGATQQQIGNKGEQNHNHRRLAGIERAQHLPLVDDIHDDAKNQDPSGRDDALPQTSAAPLRVADAVDQSPDIGSAPEAGVADSVARRGEDRHRRLQNEAKGHRAAGPIEDVPPQPAEALGGDPIPDNPEGDEAEEEHGGQLRRQNRAFRRRVSQGADILHAMRQALPEALRISATGTAPC